jgi:hypothetical protein
LAKLSLPTIIAAATPTSSRPNALAVSPPDLGVCRKTISQRQFSTATTDFFLFSVDRWLYLPAEGSISALFR